MMMSRSVEEILMPDDTFIAAALPRYLEHHSGMATKLTELPRAQVAKMLRAWLITAQAQRAILLDEIARLIAEEDGTS